MGRVKYSEFVDRIDIDALESDLGFDVLSEDGKGNDVGYCLFPENHANGDTTGKFAIHREMKVYNCYVCGGGSLLSLVMELNDWDSETAENYLRPFATDLRQDTEFVDDFLQAFAKDIEKRVDTLPYFNPRVLDKWPYAYDYGAQFDITPEVIERYGVRYVEDLKKPSPVGGKFAEDPDYIGSAIVFPHYWNGRLVGWQARWGVEDRPKWVPRWTNTVDLPRDNTAYGYDQWKNHEVVVLVESAKTVLWLASLNVPAVGTFGDSVTEAHLRLVRRAKTILLAPDNDPAGKRWLTKCYNYLKRFSEVAVIPPVKGLKSDLVDLGDFRAFSVHLTGTVRPEIDGLDFDWAFSEH